MSSKVAGDEVFMHYFQYLSSASGGFTPDPHRGSAPEPHWEITSVLRPFNLPTPGKNPAAAHG